jgi:hypothetical protein
MKRDEDIALASIGRTELSVRTVVVEQSCPSEQHIDAMLPFSARRRIDVACPPKRRVRYPLDVQYRVADIVYKGGSRIDTAV